MVGRGGIRELRLESRVVRTEPATWEGFGYLGATDDSD
jgi:hypothetical protein